MERIEMTMRKRLGKIYDVFLGEMHLFTASELVARPICDSFNQRDTLKAKADLVDKLVEWHDSPDDIGLSLNQRVLGLLDVVGEILSKAKKLSQ
jgi:hypothetical protein